MNRIVRSLIYFFTVALLFTACSKDISNDPPPGPNNLLGNFTVTVENRLSATAKINWTKPSNTSGAAIVYKTYLNSALINSGITDTFYTFTNLLPNQVYQGRVVAYTSATDSSSASFTLSIYSGAPAFNVRYLDGYYKVTESEYDLNNPSDKNNLVFTGRIAVIDDTVPVFYQRTRVPATWWGADFGVPVIHAWNDSLYDLGISVRGRILSPTQVRLTYGYGVSTTVFFVSQNWEKLANPNDSSAYAYTWPANSPGLIKTFAGNYISNGNVIPHGDGGPALNASLSYPRAIYFDAAQNAYIGDGAFSYHAVRKVNTAGTISLFAGNYSEGFSGDGGLAVNAQLFYALGMIADASGNVFIADMGNRRIRKVNSAGIISTYAGTGSAGYSGDGGPASVADIGPVTDIAADNAGNIYLVTGSANRVRKIDIVTGIITTVAGNGQSGFSGDGGLATAAKLKNPNGITVDNAGNLYIADKDNYVVRKVSTSGIITTVAGLPNSGGYTGDGGPATSAKLANPYDVAVDQNGNLYISGGGVVRKVNTSGIITRFAGNYSSVKWSIGPQFYGGDNGPADQAAFSDTYGLCVSGNALYVVDASHRIRKIFL